MTSPARRRTRAVLALAALAAVLATVGMWLRDSSLVAVERVSVTGIDGEQAGDVRRALRAAALEMTTLHVREDALRDAVARFPVVRGVRADADLPDGLRIVVEAREPVAALRAAGGGSVAVAADGTLLRGAPTAGLAVVGVRATPGGRRLERGDAADAVRALAAAPPALRARVARVYRGRRGFAATLERGPKLYLGGPSRLRAKWAAAARVLAHDSSRGAAYVDVRLPERPAAGGLQPRPNNTQAQV